MRAASTIRATAHAVLLAVFALLPAPAESTNATHSTHSTHSAHWAFQPIHPHPDFGPTTIDALIDRTLAEHDLTPNPPANRRVLLRRLSLTLTGLPPTPAEMAAWLADDRPDAWSHQIERLLASPAFGEKSARAWLDVARYADSNGQDENKAMAHAWRYRDWVINTFNRDLPFADFLRHQLAGDRLPNPSPDNITATGFLSIGPKILAEQDKAKMIHDIVDEQIDTTGRAFLGLTLGCARCHDHFFDPVSQEDYFALAGIFQSTRTMADTNFVSRWLERDITPSPLKQSIAAHNAAEAANTKARSTLRVHENAALKKRLHADTPAYLAGTGTLPDLQKRFHAESQKPPLKSRLDEPNIATLLATLDQASTKQTLVPGKSGGAHPGASGHKDIPHHPDLDPATLTLETWVRFNRWPDQKKGDDRRWIVNKNQNEWEKGHYALLLREKRAAAYLAPEGGRAQQILVSGPTLKLHHWHHLALTYDGSRLRLFVDGKPAGASPAADRPRQPATGHLRVAGRADGYNAAPELDIDEVRLYNRPLSPGEIATRFRAPANAPALPGQVRRLPFDPITGPQRAALANAELQTQAKRLFALPKDPVPWWSPTSRTRWDHLTQQKETLAKTRHQPTLVMAVEDGKPTDSPLHKRGNHLRPSAAPVPRGFPRAVAPHVPVAVPPGTPNSGRAALADWMLHPKNPLPARVYVNRIWQAHFGRGLVPTPDNFGPKGTPPSHPELLDALAADFLRHGGSTKHLHRRILHSRAWQRASQPNPAAAASDPENQFLWRMPIRRLTAEELRDSLLATSGRLDRTLGGSLTSFKNHDYVPKKPHTEIFNTPRRSIYLPVLRDRVHELFTLFDFPEPSASTSQRDTSEVPLQALFFLNSSLVASSANALAENLPTEAPIPAAFNQILLRPPTPTELTQAQAYLTAGGTLPEFCQTLYSTNEFLYID